MTMVATRSDREYFINQRTDIQARKDEVASDRSGKWTNILDGASPSLRSRGIERGVQPLCYMMSGL